MKTILAHIARTMLLVPMMVLGLSVLTPAVTAAAESPGTIKEGAGSAKGDSQQAELFGDNGVFRTVTNVLLFIIGAIAVIMLIIGGIRYVLSGGDQAQVTSAKNTILYAIIGIVVAILAYAAVDFVINSFAAGE